MRRVLKITGWVLVIPVLAAFFLCVGAALHVRVAISEGALDKPVFRCIDPVDADRLEELYERTVWKSVQVANTAPGSGSSDWHMHGAIAWLGTKLTYTAEERRLIALPNLQATPECKRSSLR